MKPTTTTPAVLRTPKRRPEPTVLPQEQIRFRAYELYERRGRENGHELDDWLQAESELIRRETDKTAA